MIKSFAVVAMSFGIVGCSSTIKVTRIPPDAPLGSAKDPGLPIQLTSPEFTVTETPASDKLLKPTYTINLSYRPDPGLRYAVNLDSAFLHEGDFKIALGSQGQLTQMNTATREQLTPTIIAVGQFTASLVGTAAKFAAAADVSPLGDMFTRGLDDNAHPKICKGTDEKCPDGLTTATAQEIAVRKAMVAHMNLDAKNGELTSKFYPRNAVERRWLITAEEQATNALTLPENSDATQLGAVIETFNLDADKTSATLDSIIKSGDLNALSRFRDNLNSTADHIAEAAKKSVALAQITALYNAAKKRLVIWQDILLLNKFITMSDSEWRNHRATDLEYQISQLQRDAISRPSRVGLGTSSCEAPVDSAKVRELKNQLARTIDAVDQYRRASVLHSFLCSIPQRELANPPAIKGPAMTEYVAARQEYDALLATILQKRMALGAPTPTAPPVAREIRPLTLCNTGNDDPKCGAETIDLTWIRQQAEKKGSPEFVIVISKGKQL